MRRALCHQVALLQWKKQLLDLGRAFKEFIRLPFSPGSERNLSGVIKETSVDVPSARARSMFSAASFVLPEARAVHAIAS